MGSSHALCWWRSSQRFVLCVPTWVIQIATLQACWDRVTNLKWNPHLFDLLMWNYTYNYYYLFCSLLMYSLIGLFWILEFSWKYASGPIATSGVNCMDKAVIRLFSLVSRVSGSLRMTHDTIRPLWNLLYEPLYLFPRLALNFIPIKLRQESASLNLMHLRLICWCIDTARRF